MMQAADARQGDDLGLRAGSPCGLCARRAVLREREMTAILVIVADILAQQPAQVLFPQDEDMVEKIPSR